MPSNSPGAIAQAKYRLRHPERVRAASKKFESRPERKKANAEKARRKRKTEAHKKWRQEYLSRKNVREAILVASKKKTLIWKS